MPTPQFSAREIDSCPSVLAPARRHLSLSFARSLARSHWQLHLGSTGMGVEDAKVWLAAEVARTRELQSHVVGRMRAPSFPSDDGHDAAAEEADGDLRVAVGSPSP